MTAWVPISARMCGAARWPYAAVPDAPGQGPRTQAASQAHAGQCRNCGVVIGATVLLIIFRLQPLTASFVRKPGTPNPLLSGLCASVGTGFWPFVLIVYMISIAVPLLRRVECSDLERCRARMPMLDVPAHMGLSRTRLA